MFLFHFWCFYGLFYSFFCLCCWHFLGGLLFFLAIFSNIFYRNLFLQTPAWQMSSNQFQASVGQMCYGLLFLIVTLTLNTGLTYLHRLFCSFSGWWLNKKFQHLKCDRYPVVGTWQLLFDSMCCCLTKRLRERSNQQLSSLLFTLNSLHSPIKPCWLDRPLLWNHSWPLNRASLKVQNWVNGVVTTGEECNHKREAINEVLKRARDCRSHWRDGGASERASRFCANGL